MPFICKQQRLNFHCLAKNQGCWILLEHDLDLRVMWKFVFWDKLKDASASVDINNLKIFIGKRKKVCSYVTVKLSSVNDIMNGSIGMRA